MLWERHHAANTDPSAIALSPTGAVFIAGGTTNNDFFAAKYSGTDGNVQWTRTMNGPGDRYDYATAVAVDAAGNAIVTGSLENASLKTFCYTVKFAGGTGSTLWEHSRVPVAGGYSAGAAIALNAAGDAVVAGRVNPGAGQDFYAVKLAAANGVVVWQNTTNGTAQAGLGATTIAMDAAGDPILSGQSSHPGSFQTLDFLTVKYAGATGALVWSARQLDMNPYVTPALALDGVGGVFVSGPDGDALAIRYSATDGSQSWLSRYDGPQHADDEGEGVAFGPSGDVFVVSSIAKRLVSGAATGRFCLEKYAAATGALLWRHTFPGFGSRGAVDAAGDVVAAGRAIIAGVTGPYLGKFSGATGATLWERFDQSVDRFVLDAAGHVFGIGVIGTDVATRKLAGVSGALLWERVFSASAKSDDRAGGIVLDGAGNVVVAGNSITGFPIIAKMLALKYVAATGATVWERVHNTSGTTVGVSGLAVDAAGRILVLSRNSFSGDQLMLQKLASATGDILWTISRSGAAYALAVDPSDNVFVLTEDSFERASLIKCAASNGAVLWNVSPPSIYRYQSGRGLVLNSAGDPTVAITTKGDESQGIGVYRYAGATGALLASHEYQGPDEGERSRALAFGPGGTLAITGTKDFANDEDSDVIVTLYQSPAAEWRFTHFGTASDTGPGADLTDPDRDGTPNLLELATGTHPLLPTPRPGAGVRGADGLEFTFQRAIAVAGEVPSMVEWTSDLATGLWSSAGVSETILGDDGIRRTIRATIPGGGAQDFVRLRATRP